MIHLFPFGGLLKSSSTPSLCVVVGIGGGAGCFMGFGDVVEEELSLLDFALISISQPFI